MAHKANKKLLTALRGHLLTVGTFLDSQPARESASDTSGHYGAFVNENKHFALNERPSTAVCSLYD